jgi:hypothetical protein
MPTKIVTALLDNEADQFMSTFIQQGMRALKWEHVGPSSLKYQDQEYQGDTWRLQIDSSDHKTYAIIQFTVHYGWLGRQDAGYYDAAVKAGMDSHAEVQFTAFNDDLRQRERHRKENERRRAEAAAAGQEPHPLTFMPYHYRDIGSLTWQFSIKKKQIPGYQKWFMRMAREAVLPVLNMRSPDGNPMMGRDEFQAAITEWVESGQRKKQA